MRSDPLGEFESFARWLYLRHAEPLRDRRSGMSFGEIRDDSLPNLTRSVRLLRFAEEFVGPNQDASETVTTDALGRAFAGGRDGAQTAQVVMEPVGPEVISTIEGNYRVVADGIRVDHFAIRDLEVLRLAGSADPHADLYAIVGKAKSRRMREMALRGELSRAFDEAPARVVQEEPERQYNLRRVRGASHVGQGALLLIVDVAMMLEGLAILTPGLVAVQAIASIVGGLVEIADGVETLGS